MVGEWQGVPASAPHSLPISTRAARAFHLDQRKLGSGHMVERRVDLLLAVGKREPGLHSVEPCAAAGALLGGLRSEWTMPRPAVIRLTAPGSITWLDPTLSRWWIAPSNK